MTRNRATKKTTIGPKVTSTSPTVMPAPLQSPVHVEAVVPAIIPV
jgi:hypothetical protein